MEIQTLLGKHAIEEIEPPAATQGFFSIYFIIPKKDGGFRPILDLRDLNKTLKYLPFRMLRTSDVLRAIEPQDWMVKVDLKDAYFHVPIAPHHRHFLRFHFEGKTFQFNVLPFGLSLAPRVFSKVVQAALAPLQQKGICVLPYLDDWLLCAENPTKVADNLRHLLTHIAKLGFSINQTKCQLIPGQCIQFLGVQLNSRNMTASLTKIRAQKILTMLTKIKTGRSVTYLTLLRLAGMLAAATPVVRLGMLNLRPFQRWLIGKHLSAKTQKYTLVKVTYAAWQSLKPWRSKEFLMQGVALGPPPARREIVTTDASQQGWGGVWQQMGVRGTWGKTIRFQHINYLELKAVYLTLTHFSNQLIHKHVLIRSDNVSTVFNINHQGGTRSLKLLQAAHELWVWADTHLCSLRATHIPGT